jgi:hypothetical protein
VVDDLLRTVFARHMLRNEKSRGEIVKPRGPILCIFTLLILIIRTYSNRFPPPFGIKGNDSKVSYPVW